MLADTTIERLVGPKDPRNTKTQAVSARENASLDANLTDVYERNRARSSSLHAKLGLELRRTENDVKQVKHLQKEDADLAREIEQVLRDTPSEDTDTPDDTGGGGRRRRKVKVRRPGRGRAALVRMGLAAVATAVLGYEAEEVLDDPETMASIAGFATNLLAGKPSATSVTTPTQDVGGTKGVAAAESAKKDVDAAAQKVDASVSSMAAVAQTPPTTKETSLDKKGTADTPQGQSGAAQSGPGMLAPPGAKPTGKDDATLGRETEDFSDSVSDLGETVGRFADAITDRAAERKLAQQMLRDAAKNLEQSGGEGPVQATTGSEPSPGGAAVPGPSSAEGGAPSGGGVTGAAPQEVGAAPSDMTAAAPASGGAPASSQSAQVGGGAPMSAGAIETALTGGESPAVPGGAMTPAAQGAKPPATGGATAAPAPADATTPATPTYSNTVIGGKQEAVAGQGFSHLSERVVAPATGQITSGSGWRQNPTESGKVDVRLHHGVDIAGQAGSPIVAVMSGKVTYAGEMSGYGNRVVIAHADGRSTAYSHMFEVKVQKGTMVQGGQQVGTMGNTGHGTGVHLDFEYFDAQGNNLDPAELLHLRGTGRNVDTRQSVSIGEVRQQAAQQMQATPNPPQATTATDVRNKQLRPADFDMDNSSRPVTPPMTASTVSKAPGPGSISSSTSDSMLNWMLLNPKGD